MAASTVRLASADRDLLVESEKHANQARLRVGGARPGVFFFEDQSQAVATTSIDEAGDKLVLYSFPANCRLLALQVAVTDMDTDATPAIAYKLTCGGVDITGNLNNAQSASSATPFSGKSSGIGGGNYAATFAMDVSGNDLELEIVTPADTPAAGTITTAVLIALL